MIISRWLARRKRKEEAVKENLDRLNDTAYERYRQRRTRRRVGLVRTFCLVWIAVGIGFYMMATGADPLVAFFVPLAIFCLAHIDTVLRALNRD